MTCRTYKILENNGDNYSNISKIVSWQLTWEGITRKLDEISMCQESWTDTGKQIGAIQQDHFPSRHSRSPRNDSVNCKFAQHDLILQAACYMDLIMVKASSILLWVLDMLEFYESSGLRSSSCSRREWANGRGRTLVARSTSLAAQSRSWPVEVQALPCSLSPQLERKGLSQDSSTREAASKPTQFQWSGPDQWLPSHVDTLPQLPGQYVR